MNYIFDGLMGVGLWNLVCVGCGGVGSVGSRVVEVDF